jgi:hypothetical protein
MHWTLQNYINLFLYEILKLEKIEMLFEK